MYELLDTHVCWIGAMSREDIVYRLNILLHAASQPVQPSVLEQILTLCGGFPALLKAVGQWWLEHADMSEADLRAWLEPLMKEENIRYRLARLWNGLTQEEQFVLSEVQK